MAIGSSFAQIGLPPVIVVQPLDQIALDKGSATFIVAATSLSTMSYKWYREGVLINGAAGSTYTVSGATAGVNDGHYQVEVINASGSSFSRVATLTVLGGNDVPLANDDIYTTLEDTILTIPAAGVLTNDVDTYPGTLTAILVSGVSHGTLNFSTNGSFTYIPNTNYNGSDSFTYQASDGLITGNVATVTINITPVNDPPIAVNDTVTTLEDTSVTINVLANDSDVEGPLAVISVTTTNGTAAVVGTDVVYTPATNFYGTAVLNYTISDGTNSATARITVTVTPVNDPPIARDDYASTLEDTSVTIKVTMNDTDPENTRLTLVSAFTTNGAVVISSGTNIIFTPSTNYYGTVVFSYTTTDGTNTASANVTVTVNPVNDAPFAANYSTNTLEDTSVTIDVLANDTDPEDTPLIVTSAVSTNGTTAISGPNIIFTPATNFYGTVVFTYTISDGTNSATANVTVIVAPVNDAPFARDDSTNTLEDVSVTIKVLANDTDPEGTRLTLVSTSTTNGTAAISGTNVVFTPATNYYGTVVFSYTISDGTNSATANVTVTVTPVNDAPIAVNDIASTLEDVSVTIPVLANDSDVEGTPLIITSAITTNGTAVISGTNIVFKPATNYNGTVVFTYSISDGTNSATANVTVTVIPDYDAPVANNDSVTTAEDTSITIQVMANDYNPDGTTLTISNTSTTNGTAIISGTNVIFTPTTNFYGTTVFSYTISDGTSFSTANVTVTVTPVNDAPVAINDTYTTQEDVRLVIPPGGVLTNDFDVENNPFTAVLLSGVSHGSLVFSNNGGFTYTPSTNYNGIDTFTYAASDGQSTGNIATVTINVAPVYDAPIAVNDNVTISEDSSASINVLLNDYNPDGTLLTLTTSTTNGSAIVNGTNIVFTPDTNFNGTVVFSYTISDGFSVSTARVTVTVTAVNDAPIARDDAYTTLEDVPLAVPAPGVLNNDTDVENNALTASLLSSVSHGSLTLNANGSFTYTPATNYFGSDSFTYRVSDGSSNSAPATVSIRTVLNTPLRIVSAAMVTNGFKLKMVGPSPAAYTVLASTNNTDWIPISIRVAPTGTAEYTDTAATNNSVRFYAATAGGQSTIILEQNTGGGNKVDLRPGKNGAQSFSHGVPGDPSYTISKVVLYLSRDTTAPNTNMNFNIGTELNASALAGSSVNINPLSITNTTGGSSFQAYEILYSTAVGPLTAGTTYYLNLDNEAPNSAKIYLNRSGSAVYPNGTFFRGGGDQSYDIKFDIFGQ